MKAFSRRGLAVALSMGAMATTAVAGYKTYYLVIVQLSGSSPYASGDLGYVRNSSDPSQYISCYSAATYGLCSAANSVGDYASCSSTDPAMLAVIRSLNGDSWLRFSWNPDGTCSDIRVRESSMSAPK